MIARPCPEEEFKRGDLEGWTSQTSYVPGETVDFRVHRVTPGTVSISIYRYGANGEEFKVSVTATRSTRSSPSI